MKIINVFIAYFLYFISPKTLIKRSFIGTLLYFDIRLPDQVTNEIVNYLYDVYIKNKEIDKIMNRGGMTINMETMLALIQSEAFFIKDYLSSTYSIDPGHEKVLSILKNIIIKILKQATNPSL